jgi:hypothetical protein
VGEVDRPPRSPWSVVTAPLGMTTGGAPARPWHVSDRFRGDVPGGVERSLSGARTVTAPGPMVLAPLWRRVVTGQALTWRIRRLLNAVLWRRRRAARRAVLWLDRRPELRHTLATEGTRRLGSLMVSTARSSRSARPDRSGRRRHGYRPTVEVPSDLDVTDLRHSAALRGVDVVRRPGAAHWRVHFVDPLIVVQPVDHQDAETGHRLLDAIDTSLWNPRWFQLSPTPYTVRISELPHGRGRHKARTRATVANRSRLVICDDGGGAAAGETARTLAELAASGAPLVGAVSDDVARFLGPDVSELVRLAQPDDLLDNGRREQHSVALRRAALLTFSPRGRWRSIGEACGVPGTATPSVSVLLASNRPADVLDAARQIAAQQVGSVQLVVGLHGRHMPRELGERLVEAFPGDLVVHHLPAELNLGQVLNALTADADGELVTKWDDDDWYDSRHLADLVAALEYSGADMVAKAAEFVYLESLDLTVRRFAVGSERFSTTVAGGTLMLARSELQRVGWADVPRRVDRLLIEALERRSGRVYRTHGLGYVLRRRSDALGKHTWQAGDAYFLRQSVDQRPGLDLVFAGFSVPSNAAVAS